MNGAFDIQRQPRSSDGSEGLPPVHRKRKKKGKGSLQTTSVPLSPSASGEFQHLQQSKQLQQPSRLSMSTGKISGNRRATMSDAGHLEGVVDVTLKLAPILDRCAPATSSCSSVIPNAGETTSTATSSPRGFLTPQQPAPAASSAAVAPSLTAPAPVEQLSHLQQVPKSASASGANTQTGLNIPPMHQHQLSAVPNTRTTTLQPMMSLEPNVPDPPPSLWGFFSAEATPHEKYPTADVLWRQTERDRVYNFLLHVPYQLERIMIFGTLLCLYSFLGALTVLPLRCLRTLWQLLPSLKHKASSASNSSSSSGGGRMLPGAQLYDLLCVLLLLCASGMLSRIQPGVIYYWMKDITSEFLKIQVIFTALEILDKILSNFGVDVLEALSSTCTLFTRHRIGFMQLVSDFAVALLLITAHGSVLLCQAMVFAVTMNSRANAMLALMIATNFVELKGQVYKRTDTNKLWTLACQDIVERFELLLVLSFVVVEDISNSGVWAPATSVLLVCARIFFWEVIIDIAKHAVLGKFNDIRPGIYREYMRDLCTDSLEKHSHNSHKLVGFCPLGPAALCLRMMHTLFTLKADGHPDWQLRIAVVLLAWFSACIFQVVLGFSMKWVAYLYVRHHAALAGGKTLQRAINVTPAGAKLAPAGAAAAAKAGLSGANAGGASASPAPGASGAFAAVPTAAGGAASPVRGLASPRSTMSLFGTSAPGASTVLSAGPAAAAAVAAAAAEAASLGDLDALAHISGSSLLGESKSLTGAVMLADGSNLTVKGSTRSDEFQLNSCCSSDSSAGPAVASPQGGAVSAAGDLWGSSDAAAAAAGGSSGAAVSRRGDSAAGVSSSYAAPSAAGLSLRVYTRSPSCADFPAHGVKQVAVEQC